MHGENLLENNKALNNMQFGLRKGRGSDDSAAFIINYILNEFSVDNFTLPVFIDIKSTYNHVNIYKL